MGEALLAGLLRTGWVEPGQVTIVEPDAQRRADLAAAHPGVALATESVDADGAVVAVKPGHVIEACRALAGVRVGRVLSIAAGVATATIELALGAEVPVVRAMPNTPALVGVGASAVAPGRWASDDDLAWARDVLGAVGVVETVPESLLDAVTGLSGSGPAYVYLVAEALVDAGVLAGLPRPTAEVLAHQTLLGAATMLVEQDRHPAQLRADVTSPGGTTAAGLHVLERAGVRGVFQDAVRAATERSIELGSSATKL